MGSHHDCRWDGILRLGSICNKGYRCGHGKQLIGTGQPPAIRSAGWLANSNPESQDQRSVQISTDNRRWHADTHWSLCARGHQFSSICDRSCPHLQLWGWQLPAARL